MEQVSVLDVRKLGSSRSSFVQALGAAFEQVGFVSLVGHGIDSTLTAPVYEAMRRVFALPEATKRKYVLPGSGGARGYTPFGVETAKDQSEPDLKEFWHVGPEVLPGNPHRLPCNVWPEEVPELREASAALWGALAELGREICRL